MSSLTFCIYSYKFCLLTIGTTPGAVNGAEKPSKDGASRGFRELKEALKILESLKNMTVEQLWTGGSPTSPTSAEPASTAHVAASVTPTAPEKPTKEKRFLDDIKKLQENLRKTLDNVAIVEEEKMEAVVEAGGSGATGTEVGVSTTSGCNNCQSRSISSKNVLHFDIFSPADLLLFRQNELERKSPSRSRRHRWVDRNGPASSSATHLYCANRVVASLASPSPVPREKCSLCWSGHQVRKGENPVNPFLLFLLSFRLSVPLSIYFFFFKSSPDLIGYNFHIAFFLLKSLCQSLLI